MLSELLRQADFKMLGRIGGQTFRCTVRRPVARRKLCERKFSAYTANAGPSTTGSSIASPLGTITAELDRVAPCFEVPASRINILDSPASFYKTLKVGVLLWGEELRALKLIRSFSG